MSRCIIHIGMHKTGTSSIQHSLQGFSSRNWFYAELGGVANHSLPIYSLFAPHPERHHIHRATRRDYTDIQRYNKRVLSDLEHAIASAGDRTLIISGEDIGILPRPALVKLHDHFRSVFNHLTIAGYVRPPAEFMASSFQERIKGGSLRDFDIEGMYRNYEAAFGKFYDVFGEENVLLWKYHPASFPERCVVRDFCERFGIDLPRDRIVRTNESFSRQVVGVLYTYRKFEKSFGMDSIRGSECQKLGRLLSDLGADKFKFSPEIVSPILQKNREDIEWMESRLGEKLQDDLGAPHVGDVREEADLLNATPATVATLRAILGRDAPPDILDESPESTARLVHVLRETSIPTRMTRNHGQAEDGTSLAGKSDRAQGRVSCAKLTEQLRKRNPGLFSGISEEDAMNLLRGAFEHIDRVLAEAGEGTIDCPGLGEFRARKIIKQSTGDEVLQIRLIRRKTARSRTLDPTQS